MNGNEWLSWKYRRSVLKKAKKIQLANTQSSVVLSQSKPSRLKNYHDMSDKNKGPGGRGCMKCTPRCEVSSYLVSVNTHWSLVCLLSSLQVMLHRTAFHWVSVPVSSSVCLCLRAAQLWSVFDSLQGKWWRFPNLVESLLCPAVHGGICFCVFVCVYRSACVCTHWSACVTHSSAHNNSKMNPLISRHIEFKLHPCDIWTWW